MQLGEVRESGVDLAFVAGLQDLELHSLVTRRLVRDADNALGTPIDWVHEEADHTGLGHQLRQQFEPLGIQFDGETAEPVRLPPGRARLVTRPSATGSPPRSGIDVLRGKQDEKPYCLTGECSPDFKRCLTALVPVAS